RAAAARGADAHLVRERVVGLRGRGHRARGRGRVAHHRHRVGGGRADQRRDGHPDRLGARPRRLPRQGRGQRADRSALRAADHRGQHRAAVAVRPAEPGEHPPQRHPARPGGGAGLRDAAVRGALGAAGAHRGRSGGRAGGAVARREQLGHLPADHPARADPGHHQRRRPGLRPCHRRVRLGGAHRRSHPAQDRGGLPVHPEADRDRPAGQRRRGLGGPAGDRVRDAAGAALPGRSLRAQGTVELMKVSPLTRLSLRTVALGYLFVLLVLPLLIILWRTFENGIGAFVDSITTPAAISALQLSLLIVAIVVPLNVVFGVITALALVRGRFHGRNLIQGIVDLPFAVSTVVVGVALILLWGAGGWFGGVESLGFEGIFSLPGMVIATIFVTLPFVA